MIMSRTNGEEKTKWESKGKGERVERKEKKRRENYTGNDGLPTKLYRLRLNFRTLRTSLSLNFLVSQCSPSHN
jgi:hypothetical protein